MLRTLMLFCVGLALVCLPAFSVLAAPVSVTYSDQGKQLVFTFESSQPLNRSDFQTRLEMSKTPLLKIELDRGRLKGPKNRWFKRYEDRNGHKDVKGIFLKETVDFVQLRVRFRKSV